MAWNRSGGTYGELTGYPALIFVELKDWGRNQQTYMECLRSLHKLYSHLNAKLPLLVKDSKDNEMKFETGLKSIDNRITDALHLYNPDFEDPKSYPDGEDEFNIEMFGIFTEIDTLVAESHVIDNQRITSSPAPGADE